MNSILKFKPFFKSVLWGGKRIAEFKGLPSQGDHIGESWELSPMPGHESVVAEGEYAGKTLPELVNEYPVDMLGEKLLAKGGKSFPLLIKFIDSSDDLSIQVHPDDELAQKRHNSLGKTEMWYSVLPTDDAYLYAGFNTRLTPDEFRGQVADNTIVASLKKHNPKQGDVFFLPAGRVHSIGRGNFVLEIQEASDITYRIYDYDRRDANGQPRQLHVEESVDSINFADTDMGAAKNVKAEIGKESVVESCSYFTTTLVGVDKTETLNLANRDSFTVLVSIKGNFSVKTADGQIVSMNQGETIYLPASLDSVELIGSGEVITIFVP